MPTIDRRYEQFLDKLVDEIFEVASERWTWHELALNSGLAPATVARLGNRETRLPQLRTIFRLANSLGMDVKLIERRVARLRRAA